MVALDIDMPQKCNWCPLKEDGRYCTVTGKYITSNIYEGKPHWCPIKGELEIDSSTSVIATNNSKVAITISNNPTTIK